MPVLTETTHAGECIVSEASKTRSRDPITLAAGAAYAACAVLGKATLGAATSAEKTGGNTGDGAMGAITLGAAAVAGAYLLACVGGGFSAAAAFDGTIGTRGALTLADPAVGAAVKPGVYRVTCIEPATDAGTFSVEDPDGVEIGVATVGVAFDSTHIKFTIADGATDFGAGDAFNVTVTAAVPTGLGDFTVTAPDGTVLGTATVGTPFVSTHINFTIGAPDAAEYVVGDGFTVTVAAGSGHYKMWNPANVDGSQVASAILFEAVDATDGALPGVGLVRDLEVNASELVWFTGATTDNKAAGLAQLAAAGIIGR